MKKYFNVLFICLAVNFNISAQHATIASIQFNEKPQSCISTEYAMSAVMTEGALKKKMSDAKFKSPAKTRDGFLYYAGVVILEISNDRLDIYFKTEAKSNSTSALNMLLSKGYDNFITKASDPKVIENGMLFLEALAKDVMRYGLTAESTTQTELWKDAEKDYNRSIRNGETLAKEKIKLESKLTENRFQQAKLKSNIENETRMLEQVKNKTGTIDEMNAIKKDISRQENAVKKALKNYKNEQEDELDLKKDLEKNSKETSENLAEQARLKVSVETLKEKVEDLKRKIEAIK